MTDDEMGYVFATSSQGERENEDDGYQAYDEDDKYDVEQFMLDGMHFSHNHRLSLVISSEEEEDKADDDDDDWFCRICGLPIFVSTNPAYICTKANNACKFFIHQQCALKLPPKLTNSFHSTEFLQDIHYLRIVSRSSTKFMTYECKGCDDFKIHPLVEVSGVEIKIKHSSHPSHEMVAVCKQISCECDVCGKMQHGFFFECHNCNFWIHQDCTTLPNFITFAAHSHPFILVYSLPLDQLCTYECIVCKKQLLSRRNGIYFCPQTIDFAHVACGLMNKFASSKTSRLALMQLPDDELINPFPLSVIRRLQLISPNVHGDELTVDKYHNHHLILTRQVSSSSTTKACTNLACDLCTRPINPIPIRIPTDDQDEDEVSFSSPLLFYKCVDNDCHFVAHKICWDIRPMTLKLFLPGWENRLARMYPDVRSYMFSSIFHCRFCHRPCNGLCYYFPEEEGDEEPQLIVDDLPFFFDLECMVAPATVNHTSHAQHILYRTNRLMDVTPLTCCRNDSLLFDVYRCITCQYFIHIRCAMLPKSIVYPQYHHHPLHLLFTTATATATGRDDSSFCEVCEEDIDLKYWLYRCSECDQSFHINCIPSVGRLSKVKFGKTYSLPDSHNHPLKLKRMLTEHTQRCGHCKRIIQGLVDQMAFFCSRCHFWLHFSCAAAAHNKNTSNKFMKLYGDFDDDAVIRKMRKKYY